jgi:hypothetical protein
MKWALHLWKALKARLGGREDFESMTPSTEAPTQGHQSDYTPPVPILQLSDADLHKIWDRWEMVAPARMRHFRDPADSWPLDPACRYIWSNHLSGAITPALHTFEVAFRNAIHSSLTDYYSQSNWFDQPSLLGTDEQKLLRTAKRNARAKARIQGRSATADDIVSELMMGFWCALLNSPYDISVFRPCLSRGFANLAPPYQVRTDLHSKVLEFKRVRNRVFHHEPIHNFPGIDQIEAELWAFAEALYPEFAIVAQVHATFQSLFHNRLVPFRSGTEACVSNCVWQGRFQL